MSKAIVVCGACDGTGENPWSIGYCAVCYTRGLHELREPTQAERDTTLVGLCDVCGRRSYRGRCTASTSFHRAQEEATERGEQGYTHLSERCWQDSERCWQDSGGYLLDGTHRRLEHVRPTKYPGFVEVHRDELEDLELAEPGFVNDAIAELRALQQVQRDHIPLWKARVLQQRALGLHLEPLEAAFIHGYTSMDDTVSMVYRTPRAVHLHEFRWLLVAWQYGLPVAYPEHAAFAKKIERDCAARAKLIDNFTVMSAPWNGSTPRE